MFKLKSAFIFLATLSICMISYAQHHKGDTMPHTLLAIDKNWVENNTDMSVGLIEPLRHPNNPVLERREGLHDAMRVGFNQWVLQENGLFRMWYTAYDGNFWSTSYAESEDGLNWTRPNLGLHKYKGSTENNIVIPGFNMAAPFRDDADPDPSRRYKVALIRFMPKSHTERWDKQTGGTRPYVNAPAVGAYAYSPNGIHWTIDENNPFPLPVKQENPSLLHFKGRYFLYTQMSNNDYPGIIDRWSRCLAVSTSDDFQHWSLAKKPGFHFDPKNGAHVQTHGTLGYQSYRDVVVGMYGKFHNSTELIDHEADLILLTSNDGLSWQQVDHNPFESIMRRAPRGEWDATFLTQANMLNAGRETYLYYAANPDLSNLVYVRQDTGLATWRLDGYGYIAPRVAWDYGKDHFSGSLTSKPLELSNRHRTIYINAKGSKLPDHQIRVELQNNTGKPLAGYTLNDCDPITLDSVGLPVTWNGKTTLPQINGKKARVKIQIDAANPKRWMMARLEMPHFYALYIDQPTLWLNNTQTIYPERGLERVHFQDPDRPTATGLQFTTDQPASVTLTQLDDRHATLVFQGSANISLNWPRATQCKLNGKPLNIANNNISFESKDEATLTIELQPE
ncbi:hypothetical protein [Poriferisphaera sp. WC338]|uniref:hypothetical protein n=1 Tax=Poriferisphaera sp. WC338 TaxID=3425129 RepID=UPI003D819220